MVRLGRDRGESTAALVRSLFCGLPDHEHRMAVFTSFSDETSGKDTDGIYTYGGWIAKERYWDRVFAREWDKRVLAGPPRIPFLHMTDIRKPAWRAEWGIDRDEGERRVGQAVQVIDKMRELYLITVCVRGSDFKAQVSDVAKNYLISHKAAKSAVHQPDSICFMWYAMCVLYHVARTHHDVTKVDFVVERNSTITDHLKHYYDLITALFDDPDFVGNSEFSRMKSLIGDFIPGGKERAPLQAADVFCWHKQRDDAGELRGVDLARFKKLSSRKGFNYNWHVDSLVDFGESIKRDHVPRAVKPKRLKS